MAKKKTEESLLDLPASFGSVSFGKKTARVGLTVEREHINLSTADKTLCYRRLTVTIFANGEGDQPGQQRLAGMDDNLELVGVADVKSFGVHSTTISFGLTFNSKEIKRTTAKTGIQFNDFAAREGRLMIAQVDEIPEDEKKADDEEGDDE